MRNQIARFGIGVALAGSLLISGGTAAQGATSEGQEGLLPLGSAAPDFHIKDVVSGKTVSLSDFAGKKALLVIFICRHCPYVKHIQSELARLGRDYADKEAGIAAISANDPDGVPEDAPEKLKEMAQDQGFVFPFLFDEDQSVAKAYTAVCTPDCFIFDGQRKLVYRGQFDASRPGGREPATGRDVRTAIDAVLAGRPVPAEQKPSVGCSIKWKR